MKDRCRQQRKRLIQSKALDASLVNTSSSGTKYEKHDTSSSSGNDVDADDADIKPVYDEEPMVEVQLTAKCNVFATGQQHFGQPEFNKEGEVDHNAEQCHDKHPLPAKLTNNQITDLSYQSLESENISLKEGQHGQFSKVKSNETKVRHDIDVIETINIELEHKVAKLLKEYENLKKHYKKLNDSIKTTRAKTIEHTTSLIAKNDEFKAQIQEKGFAIVALKNELKKLTGNSVNTKFVKSSILEKLVLQPHRNQSVIRQPTAFKHYLPKERESVVVKPHHMIAPNSSRYSSKDMVHNHYLEEAKKHTQERGRWDPIGNIFTSSTTTVDSEPSNGSNTDITNVHECIQNLDSSAGTSINVQEELTLALNAGTPFNLKNERIKVWIKENVISGRPRLHGITLIQEICARLKSQGIR
ncbi:hypothetical protein Tco_0054004 [Tanacetum coccineum]